MAEGHPFLEGDYHVAWSKLSPDHIIGDITEAIAIAQREIDRIADLPREQLTYDSVFMGLEQSTKLLKRGWNRVTHLSGVLDSKDLREAEKEMNPKVTEFYAGIHLNEKLWMTVKAAAEKIKDEPLTPVQLRFVSETLLDFREEGADLDADKKKRIKEIQVEARKIEKQYEDNCMDDIDEYKLFIDNEEELDGLPEQAKTAAKEEAKEAGQPDKWLLTVQEQSMTPVLIFCKSERIRREIYTAYLAVGTGKRDNEEIIKRLLSLRNEHATLLGFEDYTAYSNSRHMLKTGSVIVSFSEDLHDRIQKQFIGDDEQLKAFISKKTGQEVLEIMPWDQRFYTEMLKREQYDFDNETLRPYFPVEKVLSGLFNIVQTIYNIRCEEKPTYCISGAEDAPKEGVEVWHPDVKYFEVYDKETGQKLGAFYADLYTRKKKREGAWMDQFVVGDPSLQKPHLGLLVANLPKPVNGKPSLLDHYDVETIFHEFGHLTHMLLTEVPIESLAGTNVATDFVELPSQFLENWTWEKSALNHFAAHYETGEPMPDELYEKMMRAKNFRSASRIMRQLLYGRLDVMMHIHAGQNASKSVSEMELQYADGYYVKSSVPLTVVKNFHHIFGDGGYASSYYSYLWSEVLDADAFTRFQKEGVLNPETGRDFRRCILSKGNSAPPDVLFRNFMGRDPTVLSFIRREGIHE